jgi:hypothetical protein
MAPAATEHPAWCGGRGWCTVGQGWPTIEEHYSGETPIRTLFGVDLYVGLTSAPDGRDTAVALRANDPGDAGRGYDLVAHLEPEEAELLARRLVECAAEWRQVRAERQS